MWQLLIGYSLQPFNEIIELTDVQEGIIIRCIQRLDELLRDVKDAARVIGNPIIGRKSATQSSAGKWKTHQRV